MTCLEAAHLQTLGLCPHPYDLNCEQGPRQACIIPAHTISDQPYTGRTLSQVRRVNKPT